MKRIFDKDFPNIFESEIVRIKRDTKRAEKVNIEFYEGKKIFFAKFFSPLLFVNHPKIDEVKVGNIKNLNHLKEIRINRDLKFVLIHYEAGDFVILEYDMNKQRIVDHKSIHKYIVRKKQGGKQRKQGKGAGTAGGQMRLLMEKELKEEVRKIFMKWENRLVECKSIFLISNGVQNVRFIKSHIENDVVRKKIIKTPFYYKKANFKNSKDAIEKIFTVVVFESTTTDRTKFDKYFVESFKNKKNKMKLKIEIPTKKENMANALFYTPLSAISSSVSSVYSSLSSVSSSLFSPKNLEKKYFPVKEKKSELEVKEKREKEVEKISVLHEKVHSEKTSFQNVIKTICCTLVLFFFAVVIKFYIF